MMERLSGLRYLLHSGKNPKASYFFRCYVREILPDVLLRRRLRKELDKATTSCERDYILQRVNYYNKLCRPDDFALFHEESVPVGRMKMTKQKVYYFDAKEYARWFDPALRLILLEGDITEVPRMPSIVKSRPVSGDNSNSVLLNMDKVRHFIFIKDKLSFTEKKDMALFRGKVDGKPNRIKFMRKFWGNSRFSLGTIDNVNSEWVTHKLSIYDQLKYRYIMALEGNDVASNLKWIMSSNSIAVMPRPKFETWFMEGTLIPGYHYIEIKEDFSDVEEKLDYYSGHIEEAEAIIRHANDYAAQFRNRKRERLISLLVLDKYFKKTTLQSNTQDND